MIVAISCGKFVVSRVLYYKWSKRERPSHQQATIIYLGHTLLHGSSNTPGHASG